MLIFKILSCAAVPIPQSPGSAKFVLFKEFNIGLNEEEYNFIIDQNNLGSAAIADEFNNELILFLGSTTADDFILFIVLSCNN